jgi:chromosome segregation ATPase
MAKRGESIAAANKAAREKSEAVEVAGREAWPGEISALRELQAGVSAALLPVTKPSEDGALLQNVAARVVADLVNAQQRLPQLRHELGGELEMAQRDIDTKDKLIAGYERSNETASRMLEDSARELGELNKRNHDLANDLMALQARFAMLLQGPDAPPRGTCEYPGCGGPVPPGETICGRVHAPVGRRA